MLGTPFSHWPDFSEEERAAVDRCLATGKINYWTGDEGRAFEKEFAGWTDTQHAVALANGTAALDLALQALAIGPGDEVVVTPRTFLASASCVVMAGATPVFAEVDRDSQNITAGTIAEVLTPRTKALICVHLAGMPCEMDPIMDLAKAHGLAVIEDCAQAHGARYKGRSVGSIGHVGAWSFCQDKIMTTGGEGGMVTTEDRALWSSMWSFKDHGKSWEAVYERQHPAGFRWVHESIGTNWRMTEMQAAIGRIQIQRMPEWHRIRTANAAALTEAARLSAALRVPEIPGHIEHAWYKFYCFVRPEALKANWSRDRIMAEINAQGVPCYSGSCSEVYLERAFRDRGLGPKQRLPVAKELGETSLMFLVHPTLQPHEIQRTVDVLSAVARAATA